MNLHAQIVGRCFNYHSAHVYIHFSYVDIQFSLRQKVINNLQVSQNSLNYKFSR